MGLHWKNREHCFHSLLCPKSCLSFCLLSICCYAYDRFPFTTLTILLFSLSSPSPYDRVVAGVRIQGRCQWHHRSDVRTSSHKEVAWRLEHPQAAVARSPRHVSLRQGVLTTFGAVAGEVGNLLWSLVVVFLAFNLSKPLVGCKGEKEKKSGQGAEKIKNVFLSYCFLLFQV